MALTSPSFFELLFKFKGTVGGPRPDAPEDDVPPRSKAEEYAGGLEPDVALVVFGWVNTGLLSSSSSSLVSCKAFKALGMEELFGLDDDGRDRFILSDCKKLVMLNMNNDGYRIHI